MATTLTREYCNNQMNPFTGDFWKCVWGGGVDTQVFNPVIYPNSGRPDISTPPYVTKAPASATQAPYHVSQDDINATIADAWARWKPGAIGANTPFESRGVDWMALAGIGLGIMLLTKVATR